MDAWFSGHSEHRRARILEIAAARRKRTKRALRRGLRKYLEKRIADGAAAQRLGSAQGDQPIAHRLTRTRSRPKWDPCFVRDETMTTAEFVAEVEHDVLARTTAVGGSCALPHF